VAAAAATAAAAAPGRPGRGALLGRLRLGWQTCRRQAREEEEEEGSIDKMWRASEMTKSQRTCHIIFDNMSVGVE
jgi:hypothetical protein